ncbi:MAG TPA: hypothetical protein DEP00_04605 [Lachnospiraceae bacterium]|nr:hypothetical protein [Lachnospiraceae bacterium]
MNKTLSKALKWATIFSLVFVSAVTPVAAAEPETSDETVTETQEYDSTSEDTPADFPEKEGYELTDVSYETVSSKPETEEKTVTETKDTVVLNKGDETFDQTITENGVEFTLKDVTYEDAEYDLGKASITETREAKTQNELEPSIVVSHKDEKTGVTKNVTLLLTGKKEVEGDHKTLSFPFTFQQVDADVLIYDGVRIPNDENASVPPIAGFEDVYLKAIEDRGQDITDLEITSYEWTSDIYYVDGVPCRDAVVNTVDNSTKWEGTYGGNDVALGTTAGYKATATYEGTEEAETGKTVYTIKATATYTKITEKTQSGLSRTAKVVISVVGTAILALVIILILAVTSKKRKKKDKQEGEQNQ